MKYNLRESYNLGFRGTKMSNRLKYLSFGNLFIMQFSHEKILRNIPFNNITYGPLDMVKIIKRNLLNTNYKIPIKNIFYKIRKLRNEI